MDNCKGIVTIPIEDYEALKKKADESSKILSSFEKNTVYVDYNDLKIKVITKEDIIHKLTDDLESVTAENKKLQSENIVLDSLTRTLKDETDFLKEKLKQKERAQLLLKTTEVKKSFFKRIFNL